MSTEIRYEIVKRIGVISTNDRSGWTKEVNLVSWNGAEPKYDIREWSPDHQKMSKGLTLTLEEVKNLMRLLAADFREGC